MRRLEAALLHAYEHGASITLVDPAEPSALGESAPRTVQPSFPFDVDDERPTPVALAPALPDEIVALHARFDHARRTGDRDAQLCTAAVLVQRQQATTEEQRIYERYRSAAPPRPARALSIDGWTRLFHPDEDRATGDVFAVIASAALLGRISAMRRDRSLPHLDPDKRQDPLASTISAVRAIGWGAATLGMRTPPVFVDPGRTTPFAIVPALPPALCIGAPMLAGKSSMELAFHGGRQLAWFREEHFVCTLVPTVGNLEELFLAALSIGAPKLELLPEVRARIAMVAEAIVPVLDEPKQARLRQAVGRFLAQGGRTSLRRWAQAAEWTSLRAGLLLCGDLDTACRAVSHDPGAIDRVRELERFWASDECAALRRELGIAIT